MSTIIEELQPITKNGLNEPLLGEKLVAEQLITESQLQDALEQQKVQGGKLGANLISMGFISVEEFTNFLKVHPAAPKTVEDTGLDISFLADLMLKHILLIGDFRLSDLSETLKLPLSVVDVVVEYLQRNKYAEVKGASQYQRSTYTFTLTGLGQKKAAELLEVCRYVGPAPVTLEEYKAMLTAQTIKNADVNPESMKAAFSNLVISEQILKRLGPAIMSGKSIFIYGPPGTGKTSIAEAIGNTLTETVYIPYAILVGGEIVTVFDPINHTRAKLQVDDHLIDPRWAFVKRPVIMVGGELTMKTLDLEFDPISKFYIAPLQMKANNGIFIIDDLGRQAIEPSMLLNRWIIPLEKRIDFLTLHTGMKFEIPFDELVIFCTNIEPKELVDEAFLRRIRYKIKVGHPTEDEFKKIFSLVCEKKAVSFDPEVFDFLKEQLYHRMGVTPNSCHPRDLLDYIIDESRYYGTTPRLTRERMRGAWENYFIDPGNGNH